MKDHTRQDADTEARNGPANAQHGNIDRCALQDAADDPEHAADLQGHLSRVSIGEERG
ncbi:hypothetical protein NHJ13734_009488, partial [Beauveria thailandica]